MARELTQKQLHAKRHPELTEPELKKLRDFTWGAFYDTGIPGGSMSRREYIDDKMKKEGW